MSINNISIVSWSITRDRTGIRLPKLKQEEIRALQMALKWQAPKAPTNDSDRVLIGGAPRLAGYRHHLNQTCQDTLIYATRKRKYSNSYLRFWKGLAKEKPGELDFVECVKRRRRVLQV